MTLHYKSPRLFRLILASFVALSGRALYAQEQPLILPGSPRLEVAALEVTKLEAPKPKIVALQEQENHRWRFPFDRPSLTLGLLQGGAELFDGIATHRYVNAPTCRSCMEVDPVCRLFLGSKPTWPRMLSLGAIEDFSAAYLHQRMRRSPHKLVRWLAPAAPLTLIAIHLGEGASVLNATTHPCSALGPGYFAVGELDGHETCSPANPLPLAAQTLVAAPSRVVHNR